MPCFFFTFHAYASWMPDHERGYTRRGKGIVPPDTATADRYRENQRFPAVEFDGAAQRALLDEVLTAARFQCLHVHAMAAEPTHLHVLTSWESPKAADAAQKALKSSLTRRLKREFGERPWFSHGGEPEPVDDPRHAEHLVSEYVPKHGGWKWDEARGYYR